MNDELRERLDRIESLLLVIVDALSDEQADDDEPQFSLDGEPLGSARDQELPL
jgi:hypothetical protein